MSPGVWRPCFPRSPTAYCVHHWQISHAVSFTKSTRLLPCSSQGHPPSTVQRTSCIQKRLYFITNKTCTHFLLFHVNSYFYFWHFVNSWKPNRRFKLKTYSDVRDGLRPQSITNIETTLYRTSQKAQLLSMSHRWNQSSNRMRPMEWRHMQATLT